MNLTDTSYYFKKGVKIFILVAVAYYLLVLVIAPETAKLIKTVFYRPTPPNPIYGKLDPLEFIEKPITAPTPMYVLNTENGKLPSNIPEKMVVYKFQPKPFSYLAGKNAIADAEKLGFAPSDMISDLKGKLYRWRNLRSGGILEISIDSKEINLNTNINGRLDQYPLGAISEESAKEIATSLFKSIGRFEDGLYPSGTAKIKFGRITPTSVVETINTREAQIAMVDFYRSINSSPILGPDPTKGMLRVVLKDPVETSPFNFPTLSAYYWPVNPDKKASYPIISVEEAWNAVKNGKGVIVNVTPKESNPFLSYTPTRVESILIDNIYIAYYDYPVLQKYLQPIFVFEGKYTTGGTEGGYITIYFPAITKDWVKPITQVQSTSSSSAPTTK